MFSADQILDYFGVRHLWEQLTKLMTNDKYADQALATTKNPGLMSSNDQITIANHTEELIAITDKQIEALFPSEHPEEDN